jgi:hypothetical protein
MKEEEQTMGVPNRKVALVSGASPLGQIAPPSQKFPDELKRNRQKRTRDTARWILMFLGRLASPAIVTKCKQESLDAVDEGE